MNTRRRVISTFMTVPALLAGCGGSEVTQTPTLSPADGPWSAHVPGLGLVLDLTWSPDSVHGTGTYTFLSGQFGCGAPAGTGNVTFVASRSATNDVQGFMSFDNGWVPPFRGTLVSDTHVSGGFMSVDAGPCTLDLFRGLVP
jgi:hypothetical protein